MFLFSPWVICWQRKICTKKIDAAIFLHLRSNKPDIHSLGWHILNCCLTLGLFGRCVALMSLMERLNKQAGLHTKDSAIHTDMWQQKNKKNPTQPSIHIQNPYDPSPTHRSHTNPATNPERGAKVRERWRRRESDSYSASVTTAQRRLHDTATKSELMDSFLSPANMTGGVCVRVRGCCRGPGAAACFPNGWGHMGQWALCDVVRADRPVKCVFQGH